jgi:hypothetical protein
MQDNHAGSCPDASGLRRRETPVTWRQRLSGPLVWDFLIESLRVDQPLQTARDRNLVSRTISRNRIHFK